MQASLRRALATTERGPRAVPRRGSECAAPRCARGALRCSFREGGCGTAVAALNAPQLNGSSPVRRLWRRTAPLSTALLAGPYSPRRGTAPGPARRLWLSSTNTSVVLAKPWSGVRRQRHCAALSTAERMAARAQRALQHLTRVDCPSTANAVSGASFDAGHAIEHRKGVGPQGRPPYTSAGAHPAAALPRWRR